MHEIHGIESIIHGIATHAQREGAQRVLKVRLRVGEITGMNEKSLRTAFADLAAGTLLQDADLELNFFPGSQIIEIVSFDID